MSAFEVVRMYYRTAKSLEEMALDLKEIGATDSPCYIEWDKYDKGYKLARQEFLESLGL